MKRLVLLVVATAAVIAVLVTAREKDEPNQHPPAAIGPRLGSSTPPSPTSPSWSPSPASPPSPRPVYRAGTATGAAHTEFGDVRLRVTVAHRRIVRIVALELPHGNPMDVELSRPAVRTLTNQILQKQSLDVDVVSGATYTSTGYLSSLQAALDQLS
jgi:uncharacterized protein with FMN-binding domain